MKFFMVWILTDKRHITQSLLGISAVIQVINPVNVNILFGVFFGVSDFTFPASINVERCEYKFIPAVENVHFGY